MADDKDVNELANAISLVIRALLVAGRKGQPAEGLLPFTPLYFNMLRLLAEDPARPSDLGARLGVSKTTLSTAAKALEKRGLLRRAADPKDGRAQILSLSPEGADVVIAIKRQDTRNAHAMLSIQNPDERAAFASAFARIGAALNAPD